VSEQGSPIAADVVAAVTRRYGTDEAGQVLRALAGFESDRVQVAILVGAAIKGGAVNDVAVLVELARLDYRDVLMVEYDSRVDYRAELRRLGLERPYPVG
jgi:hypothetical protein